MSNSGPFGSGFASEGLGALDSHPRNSAIIAKREAATTLDARELRCGFAILSSIDIFALHLIRTSPRICISSSCYKGMFDGCATFYLMRT